MPNYYMKIEAPEFPLSISYEDAIDLAGSVVEWPEGQVTFSAFQDMDPSDGVRPVPGTDPEAAPRTVTLTSGVNEVELTLEM